MRPYGDRAFVITPPDPAGMAAAARSVTGVVDAIPGARDLVVVCAEPRLVKDIAEAVEALAPQPVSGQGDIVTVPVRYDGADLDTVAGLVGCAADDVVRQHTAPVYTVALMGFAPGFAYLSGLDGKLAAVPRRREPRGHVPVGAVALAGGWTGVYPVSSPGGWHLLGSTDTLLWDATRLAPALLRPGMRVRFEPA
jgi:KipI family sensor histidine kinase inhibitor